MVAIVAPGFDELDLPVPLAVDLPAPKRPDLDFGELDLPRPSDSVDLPAPRVAARDTTGCGDVFHGAYAMALARGMNLVDRLRWASATAALKATQHGGQAGIPDAAEVKRFLAAHHS